MTDDEYREFLTSLAQRHLQPMRLVDRDLLETKMERLMAVSRLVRASRDVALSNGNMTRPEGAARSLLAEVAKEVRSAANDVEVVAGALERMGLMDALDDVPKATHGELRRSALPAEDVELLGRCGINSPSAVVDMLILYCRTELANSQHSRSTSAAFEEAKQALLDAARELTTTDKRDIRASASASADTGSPPAAKKKRKTFNGVGKILSGTVAGAGNALMFAGTIVAPNPATGYGVIASTAIAGSICQGIGDLRGE